MYLRPCHSVQGLPSSLWTRKCQEGQAAQLFPEHLLLPPHPVYGRPHLQHYDQVLIRANSLWGIKYWRDLFMSHHFQFNNPISGWERGLHSDESARRSPMWPGFDSQTWCHMRVEFAIRSRPCSNGFSPGLSVSPLNINQHSKFKLVLDRLNNWTVSNTHCKRNYNLLHKMYLKKQTNKGGEKRIGTVVGWVFSTDHRSR